MIKGLHSSDHHLTIKRGKKTVPYIFENHTIEFNAYSDYLYRKFETLVDYTISKKFNFFISAGDIFHTTNVQRYEIDRLLKSIKKLGDAGIVFIECPGNHTTPTSLNGIHSLYMIKYYPNVFISDDYGKFIDVKKQVRIGQDLINLVICPYLKNPPRDFYKMSEINQIDYLLGRKMEITNSDFINEDEIKISEENRLFSIVLEKALLQLNSELPKDEINLFIGHFNVDGARLSGEREFSVGNGWGISKHIFDAMDAYTYMAMGHIHTHQSLSAKDNAFYTGSIAQLNFGEIEEKFVNEITISKPHELIVTKRPVTQEYQFKILDVGDCTNFPDFNSEILRMAKEHNWKDSIVEVRGILTYAQYKTLNGNTIINEFVKSECLDFNGFNFEKVNPVDLLGISRENTGEITILDTLTGNEKSDIIKLTEKYASEKNKEKILGKISNYTNN